MIVRCPMDIVATIDSKWGLCRQLLSIHHAREQELVAPVGNVVDSSSLSGSIVTVVVVKICCSTLSEVDQVAVHYSITPLK